LTGRNFELKMPFLEGYYGKNTVMTWNADYCLSDYDYPIILRYILKTEICCVT